VNISKFKGQIAQLKVELRAAEKGFVASKPTTDARYDLVIDENGELKRAQVKYAGRSFKGKVALQLQRKTSSKTSSKRSYSKDEIDLVLLYVPRTDAIYALPPSVFDGKSEVFLRFEKTLNNQKLGVLLLEDFRW
jgi:hypothetical protein